MMCIKKQLQKAKANTDGEFFPISLFCYFLPTLHISLQFLSKLRFLLLMFIKAVYLLANLVFSQKTLYESARPPVLPLSAYMLSYLKQCAV